MSSSVRKKENSGKNNTDITMQEGRDAVLPIILLGNPREEHLGRVLSALLGCSRLCRGELFCQPGSELLVVDSPRVRRLDAGGGIVLLKENFEQTDAPNHLLHAHCILPDGVQAAQQFVQRCGLPGISCGGSAGMLTLSSTQEQTVLTLQRKLKRLDGGWIAEGDFSPDLPRQLTAYELLGCAAVLLLLGRLHP